MITILGIIIALLLAVIVYYVAVWLNAPSPIPQIAALVVFLISLLGGGSFPLQ